MGWASYDRRAYNPGSHKEMKLEQENEQLRRQLAELRRRVVVDAVWDDLRPHQPATEESTEAAATENTGTDTPATS